MKKKIWDFWSRRYSSLWVQKYSLGPTREKVKYIVADFAGSLLESPGHEDSEPAQAGFSLLDIGCGTGELLYDLRDVPGIKRSGLDFSEGMIRESEKKNPDVTHYIMDVRELEAIEERFDIITCTHSLPYYPSKRETLAKISNLLGKDGRAVFAFASGNSLLDKIILMFVKLTTGPASYPGDREFRKLTQGIFHIEKREVIKLRPYMPTIAVYSLRKAGL